MARIYTEGGVTYHEVTTARDVDEVILRAAEDLEQDWFSDEETIDWEDFWGHLEHQLEDGRNLSLGNEVQVHPDGNVRRKMDTPAMRKIQRHIRAFRQL